MKKLALVAVAIMTALVCSAVAVAQYSVPVITGSLKVTPAKAGTKAKPKNGLVTAIFNVNAESNSTLSGIDYRIPKNVKLNGKGFATCSEETVATGESACSKKARVGTGSATALLGPNKSRLDFTVNVYVSSAKTLTLALTNTLVGTIAVPAKINGQVVSFLLPERVQSPAPGLFAYVTSVTAKLGKQGGVPASVTTGKGKKKKTTFFASVVGCSGGKHTGSIEAFLAANPNPPSVSSLKTGTLSSPCKAAKKKK